MTEKHVFVKDIMRTDFGTIDADATITEAISQMQELRTAVLVVNKAHKHDEYGILLISDIAREVLAKDRSPKRVNVYEVMTKPAVYVDPDMDVRYCSRLFSQLGLLRALVVKDGSVLGTVTPRGLVLSVLAELQTENMND